MVVMMMMVMTRRKRTLERQIIDTSMYLPRGWIPNFCSVLSIHVLSLYRFDFLPAAKKNKGINHHLLDEIHMETTVQEVRPC
jgi:hypothetical protein